jgi:hypothetical protein
MVDFRVVPAALEANVKFLRTAPDSWQRSFDKPNGKGLGEDDLGLLGKMEGVPRRHNEALQGCLDKLKEGRDSLENAVTALGEVAADYASRDAEYYRKFGYINRHRPRISSMRKNMGSR